MRRRYFIWKGSFVWLLVPKRLLGYLQETAAERDKLSKQVPELQQQLESELLARTDLENRNMTLKEELAFKQTVIFLVF